MKISKRTLALKGCVAVGLVATHYLPIPAEHVAVVSIFTNLLWLVGL